MVEKQARIMCDYQDGQNRKSCYQANSIPKTSSEESKDKKMEAKCYVRYCVQVAGHKTDTKKVIKV